MFWCRCDDDGPPEAAYKISQEKAKTLGIDEYIPLKVALKETVECLKEKGMVTFWYALSIIFLSKGEGNDLLQ